MVLWKFSLREVLHRPGRTTLTLLSIVIGVAIVVSISIATQTTRTAYREMFASVSGRAALEVVAEGGGPFDQGVIDAVRATPGVKAAAPVVQRLTILFARDKRAKLLSLGVDPAADKDVRDYKLVEGKLLDEAPGVLLAADLARSLDVGVGDEVKLLTPQGMQRATVVGLVATQVHLQGLAYLPLEAAQTLFNMDGEVNLIQVVAEESADVDSVRAALAARLPVGLAARQPATRTQLVEETLEPAEQGLLLTQVFSLLLATFIILNTFLMNVGERRRQLAIMRAIGATRSQIARILFRESLALGAAGAALGILLGLGGARLLVLALDRVLMASLPPLRVSWPTLAGGAAFGFGMAVVGAVVPAYRASRVSPLEGMGVVAREDLEAASRKSFVAGVLIVAASLAGYAACLLGWLPVSVGVWTAVAFNIGVVLLVPPLLGPVTGVVTWALSPLLAVESRLAHRQVLRHRARSTLTVGVLFVASATGAGMANTILDNVRDVREWGRHVIVGDFIVRAMMPDMGTGMSPDMPESLGKEIRGLPGVRAVGTARFVQATAAGMPAVVIAREFPPGEPLLLVLSEGDATKVPGQLAEGQVVVGTVLAQRAGLKLGGVLPIETRDGPRNLKIAGLANEYLVGGLAVYMERAVAERLLGISGVDAYAVICDPARTDDVQRRLEPICDRYGVLLESAHGIRQMIDGMMAGVVGCLWGTLVLGFLVAAMGTVNTLTMNVLEQTRELGLLRIVAMSRWQVRKTIFTQALVIAILGVGPGTLAGLGVAYLTNLATVLATGHPVAFGFHPWMLAGCLAAGLAIVLASAWIPAERAARLELTKALQYQ